MFLEGESPTISRSDPFNVLKAVFNKFYLVHSWILCPSYVTHKKIHYKKDVSI